MQLIAVRRERSGPSAVHYWNLEGKLVAVELRIVAFQSDCALIQAIESAMLFTGRVARHTYLDA